jgi:hypothetical protein
MGKRNLTWLRQHTNVEDLLDDGVANNSDLSSFAESEQPLGDTPVVASTETSTQSSHLEAPEQTEERDFQVAAIGVFIGGCGLDLVLHPVDMIVYHLKAIEHVTGARSEFYGAILILFGIALVIYGLKKRRI